MTVSELMDTGVLEHVAAVSERITGKKPSPSTVWRWCVRGLNCGIKLDCAFHAGCWCTTTAAFLAFIDAQTEHQRANPPGRESSRRRMKERRSKKERG